MNSSSGDYTLRLAVEEQLDLILKMEQQRKVLRKQNKLLHAKLKESNAMINKYQRQMKDCQINTEQKQIISKLTQLNLSDSVRKTEKINKQTNQAQVQCELQFTNFSTIHNFSKLNEAHSLLKAIDSSTLVPQSCQRENKPNNSNYINLKRQNKNKQTNQQYSRHQNNRQPQKTITDEMLKLTKELNLLKKQNKQLDHKYKLRDKEIKDLKKCLQSKSEALQKSKKQFNELSILLNTEKFKSIRNLQNQVQSLKAKLLSQQQNSKIKTLFIELTQQYDNYRKDQEKKVDILISQLASKEKQIESFRSQIKKLNSK